MTWTSLIYLAVGMTEMLLPLLLWGKSMPRLADARGRWHSLCIWLLGMALAIFGSASFGLALQAGAAFSSVYVAAHVLLIAYGFCRYRHSLTLSDATWRRPGGSEAA